MSEIVSAYKSLFTISKTSDIMQLTY